MKTVSLHGRREGKGKLGPWLYKVLISSMRLEFSWPNHFLKAPPLNIITLRFKFQHEVGRGHRCSNYPKKSTDSLQSYQIPMAFLQKWKSQFSNLNGVAKEPKEPKSS
jgi:hypothetical protein